MIRKSLILIILYPGKCSNYLDTNHSGYCDLSEDNIAANFKKNKSNFAIIFFLTIILFIIFDIFKMEMCIQKIILNIFLLISFITSALTGFSIEIIREYSLKVNFYINDILFAHTFSSTVFCALSLIHISRNFDYYKSLLIKK